MNENITFAAKQVGASLVDLSEASISKLEKWSDAAARPNNVSNTECAGFINKEGSKDGVNFVIDIQAPANQNSATLRIWGIEGVQDGSGIERFNNIQLDFSMDATIARTVTQKAAAITHNDIKAALAEPTTQLFHVVVGNQSGIDPTTEQLLGERYDIDTTVSVQDDDSQKAITALHAVLASHKNSAV